MAFRSRKSKRNSNPGRKPQKAPAWSVRPHQAGKPLANMVAEMLRVSSGKAAAAIERGEVSVQKLVCRDATRILRAGQQISLGEPTEATPLVKKQPTTKPGAGAITTPGPKIRIVYQDAEIVVVDKPAGVTTVRHADDVKEAGKRAKRFMPPSLVDLLPGVVKGPAHGRFRLRAVHRLDRETSGLVILARTAEAESHLGRQFRDHSIERRYHALVRGVAVSETIVSHLARDRGDHRRGSDPNNQGQRAVTHVRVLEPLGKFTFIECILETGRTHQVRIHLGEKGTPLCGDMVYDRPLKGRPVPDGSEAQRPLLHAEFLAVTHPRTGQRLSWTATEPKDFLDVKAKLEALRG